MTVPLKKANKNYKRLGTQLVQRGTNFRRWAMDKNYPVTTVYGAARGERSGIVATKIKRELEAFINEK